MRPITAVLLAWLMTAPVPAQQVEQATRGNARFGTTTQLVVEDVIVKSKDGNPVTGLKASDFTITEDGKAQKINVFEFQTLEQEAAPAPESAPKPSVEPAAPAVPPVKPVTAIQIAPEKPGDIKYRDRRLMVMFFDLRSMPIQDQIRAQNAAMKFLRTQMTRSDLMAIMTFSSDVKVVEDFTDDRDKLEKDIKN